MGKLTICSTCELPHGILPGWFSWYLILEGAAQFFFFNFIVVWIGSIYHRVTLKRKIMFKCWTIRQLALEPNSCWHEWPKLSTSIMWKVTDEKQSEAWTRISCCLPRRKVETDQMRTGMDSVLSKFSNDLFRCQVFKRVVISMRHSFHMERVYQTSIQDWW